MIRSLFVAFVTIVIVAAGPIAAQRGSTPGAKPIPVAVANGAPGVNIEFYLNAGKLADTTVNATGTANWLLDIGNLGKTRVDSYVDVCKDGKVVQVKFVTGNGQAPPEDEGCDRRVAAVSFQSDCGVISINLDFRNFAAKVIGCGIKLTDKKVLTTAGGVALGAVLLTVGGGGGGAAAVPATGAGVPQSPTVNPTVIVPAPVQNTTPIADPLPPPPTQTTLDLTGTYDVGSCAVILDRAAHEAVLRLCSLLRQLLANASNGSVTFRGDSPWVTISGTYNTQTGEFSLSTSGSVAGFNNTSVTLRGSVNSSGQFNGVLEFGANGALPTGQPVSYQIRAQKR